MENMLVVETRYREHQQRMAWLNDANGKFDKPVKRHLVRRAVAKALVAVATMFIPPVKRETQAV